METEKETVTQPDADEQLQDRLLKSIASIEERLQEHKGEGHFMGVDAPTVYHGLKCHYTFEAALQYTDLSYSPAKKEYLLVIPSKVIMRYGLTGRENNPPYKIETTPFHKIFWASTISSFLCWSPDAPDFYVATENFTLFSKACNDVPVVRVMYDEGTATIVVAGANSVTRFKYLVGSRILQKQDDTLFRLVESPMTEIELCELVPTNTGCQRLYISNFTSLFVLDLETHSLLHIQKGVHKTRITALMLYESIMWLITGDNGGAVKCWNERWQIMMVFVGHQERVVHFVPHPSLCGFASVGADKTLQVWSCTLKDKVEKLNLSGPIQFIIVNKEEECIVTLYSSFINVWYMHLLYSHHCTLSAQSTALFTPMNIMNPCRTLVVTEDSLVRVISPLTGIQLTMQYLPHSTPMGMVTYSPASETIYTILKKRGDILLSYANENPVKFAKVWLRDLNGPKITVIEVYEQPVAVFWTMLEKINPERGKPFHTKQKNEQSLVLAGRDDGTIASLDQKFGRAEFITRAHAAAVKLLRANPSVSQLISCGEDNSIKVWRVFVNFKKEPIIIYVSLYYSHNIACMGALRDTLCLAISGQKTLTHTLIMYNVGDKLRHNHPASRDHVAPIVDMSCNEMLGLCATASVDRTIRIWNEINQLHKILELNAVPQTMCFSSPKGDITLSIGKKLFKISHTRYLSSKYCRRIVLYQIPNLIEEYPKPFEEENIEMSKENYITILQQVTSLPLFSLGITEGQDKSLEMAKAKAFSHYAERDRDILSIIEGNAIASKKIPSRNVLDLKQWKHLIESITTASGEPQMLRVAGINAMNLREIRERHSRKIHYLNIHAKFKGMFGRSVTEMDNLVTFPFNPLGRPIATTGFIPNCILYRILGISKNPPRSTESHTKKHLAPLCTKNAGVNINILEDSSVCQDSEWTSKINVEKYDSPSKQLSVQNKGFREQTFQVYSTTIPEQNQWVTACQIMEGKEENINEDNVKEENMNIKPNKERVQKKHIVMTDMLTVTKDNSKKEYEEIHQASKINECDEYSLPKDDIHCVNSVRLAHGHSANIDALVNQFTTQNDIHKDISIADFINVFENLLNAKCPHSQVMTGIKNIFTKYAKRHKNTIKDAFIALFKKLVDNPNNKKLRILLQLVMTLDILHHDITAGLLTLYVMSQRATRKAIIYWLKDSCGLIDPQHMLDKHLDDLLSGLIKQNKSIKDQDFYSVMKQIEKWLVHWKKTLEYHMEQVIDQIRSGELTTGADSFVIKELEQMAEHRLVHEKNNEQGLHLPTIHDTHEVRGIGSKSSMEVPAERTQRKEKMSKAGDNIATARLQEPCPSKSLHIDLERNTMEMIVIIDDEITKRRRPGVNFIDALNYFCELETQIKGPKFQNRRRHNESCLREVLLAPGERATWSMEGNPPLNKKIQMPLPTAQLIDPYNDGIHLPNPVLLTLRTSQKYFHPRKSHP